MCAVSLNCSAVLDCPTSVKLTAMQRKRLFAAMKLDKKVSRGEITFVLAQKIGKVSWSQRVTDEAVHRALDQVAEPAQIVF